MIITDVLVCVSRLAVSVGADIVVTEIVRKNIPKGINGILRGTAVIAGVVSGALIGDKLADYTEVQINEAAKSIKKLEEVAKCAKEERNNGNSEVES